MAIRKTQFGWMVLGGLLCLFGMFLVCKVRDGNKLAAQADNDDNGAPLVSPLTIVAGSDVKPAATQSAPADGNDDKLEAQARGTLPCEPKCSVPKQKKDATPPVDIVQPPEAIMAPAAATLMQVSDPNEPLPPIKEAADTRLTAPEAVDRLPPPTPVAPSITKPTAGPAPVMPAPVLERSEVQAKETTPPPMAIPSTMLGGTPLPPLTTPSALLNQPPVPVQRIEYRNEAAEPPLAQHNGPVQTYHVKHEGETPRDIARRTLGSAERCDDVLKLNPHLKADTYLVEGTLVKLPADACLPTDDVETVQPLPVLRKPMQAKSRALPLTGTFPCNLDDKHTITLPRAIRDQLGQGDTVLISPGSDQCLWLTNQAHLDRLADHLEHSSAKEVDVRVFKRLYYAQTEKTTLSADGRVQISDRLAQYAGLRQEVVLVGIDDHFELWDAGRWREYTQQKSAAARAALGEE